MASSVKHTGFKQMKGDGDNHTFGIALGETSRALHICTADDVATDWDVSSFTHPTVMVHSATTPETNYLKFYHDASNGIIDVDATTVLTMSSSAWSSALPLSLTYAGEALDITSTTATKGVNFNLTMAAPAMSDGYGLFEVNGDISTSPTGHFAAASTWINISSAVTLPNLLNIYAVHSDGIYQDSGGAISGGILIFGSRLQAQMGDTSGWDLLCPWSINTTIAITALIHSANPTVDIGEVTNGGSSAGTLVPFHVDNAGTIRYVKMYTLS